MNVKVTHVKMVVHATTLSMPIPVFALEAIQDLYAKQVCEAFSCIYGKCILCHINNNKRAMYFGLET